MRRASAKPHTVQATLKEIAAVIRALEQILADLRQGKSYQITRLTCLKRLCTDSEVATQFAAFVAQRSLRRLLERERPATVAPERWERYVALATAGVDGIQRYLVEETPETRTALRERYSNSEAVLGCNPELAVPCNRQFAQLRFDFRRQLLNLIYFAQ